MNLNDTVLGGALELHDGSVGFGSRLSWFEIRGDLWEERGTSEKGEVVRVNRQMVKRTVKLFEK